MRAQLGGWWRLWIVLSLLWALGVFVIAASELSIDRTVRSEVTFTSQIGGQERKYNQRHEIRNVPLFASKGEVDRRISRQVLKEMESELWDLIPRIRANGDEREALLLEQWLAGVRREVDLNRPSKSISLKNSSTPRERLMEWLGRTMVNALSLPLALLVFGLTLRWVIDGFRKRKPTNPA